MIFFKSPLSFSGHWHSSTKLLAYYLVIQVTAHSQITEPQYKDNVITNMAPVNCARNTGFCSPLSYHTL